MTDWTLAELSVTVKVITLVPLLPSVTLTSLTERLPGGVATKALALSVAAVVSPAPLVQLLATLPISAA